MTITRTYTREGTTKRSAFSIVELIASIAVLAVLVAIAVPALNAARNSAIAATCLSHTRDCATMIQTYQTDHDGFFPISADTQSVFDAFDWGGQRLPYDSQIGHWPHAIRSSHGGPKVEPTWLCPSGVKYESYFRSRSATETLRSTPQSATIASDFFLARGAISDPARWTPDADLLDAPLLRAVRGAEVTFPSAKGILVEWTSFHQLRGVSAHDAQFDTSLQLGHPEASNTPRHVSFADGSAARVRDGPDLFPGVSPGSDEPGKPVLNTLHGVRGRDRR